MVKRQRVDLGCQVHNGLEGSGILLLEAIRIVNVDDAAVRAARRQQRWKMTSGSKT